MSEQINELAAALAAAQGEMSNATLNQDNPAFKGSKYADLAAIRDATIPHLSKHGLSISQVMALNGSGMLLITKLLHTSGQSLESHYPLPIADRPHIMGSAITYARRYSWAALVGIAAEADDDGNDAQEGSKNGIKTMPARKSSAQAKRDQDWPKFEQALRDCQSAREVERLCLEYRRVVYPTWNGDWCDTAEQEFSKRLAEFSQPGNLKQTLQDSIVEATDEQTTKFHECWEYLENAGTLTDIVARADNPGYREGLKILTPDQLAQLRAFYKARREELGKAA